MCHSAWTRHRLFACMIIVACTAALGFAQSTAPPVLITGGADTSGHNYVWTVINNSPARLVYIEFPQYAADLFEAPNGWEQEFINRCHLGWKDEPGKCIARKSASADGLGPNMSALFTMRIAARGAMVGKGDVTVKFDDGTTATISGVPLPVKPARGNTYLALIALGLIFVIFIVHNERRRRNRPSLAADSDDDA